MESVLLEAQGYGINDKILYQDNLSAMLLDKNGRASSSKQTRHINIRYFFVTDRILDGELNISYCPTLNMIGDYFNFPRKGGLFHKFRNTVLDITETDITRYISLAKLAWTARQTFKSK